MLSTVRGMVLAGRFDQEVTIETALSGAHPRRFAYQMRLAGGRKLASGETKHVFVGLDLKPARLPEKYWANCGISAGAPLPR